MGKTVKMLFTLLIVSIYCCGHYSEKYDTTLNQDNIELNIKQNFFENGGKLKTNYKNGEKQGYVKGYYENGNIKYTGWYTDGEKDSIWHWYYNMDIGEEVVKVVEKMGERKANISSEAIL